jgi:hypothetical protein
LNDEVKAISDWRFRSGIFVFALGWVCPLAIPLVARSDLSTEAKSILSGALLIGIPEILSIASIVILGRAGFNALKKKVLTVLKRKAFPEQVSRLRYNVGLVMFLLPAIPGYLVFYAPSSAVSASLLDDRALLFLVTDGLFLASLLVLGGEFWEKVRALFLYDARVASN